MRRILRRLTPVFTRPRKWCMHTSAGTAHKKYRQFLLQATPAYHAAFSRFGLGAAPILNAG